MRDIADQQGLPSFLVDLRHQAVHESQSITAELMEKALQHLQGFLFSSYWYPIFARLIKRNQQVEVFRQQIISFRLVTTTPNVDQILAKSTNMSEKAARQNLRTILNKYTKNNIKLSIALDMNQLIDILKVFVDCSLDRIVLKFTKLQALSEQSRDFMANLEADNSN